MLYDNGLIATIQWKLEEIAKNNIKTKLIDKTTGYQFDDGIGFDYKEISDKAVKDKKFGLYSVIERIKYLGGEIEIDTKNNKGTNVKIKLPLS